jgi:hypothetical protein
MFRNDHVSAVTGRRSAQTTETCQDAAEPVSARWQLLLDGDASRPSAFASYFADLDVEGGRPPDTPTAPDTTAVADLTSGPGVTT